MNNAGLSMSILVHNRNRADCLARCLDSILAQTARPLEVVILDAESRDASPSVIAERLPAFEAAGITVVSETCAPAGVPASRNLAASRASGDLLLFVDNDAILAGPDTATTLQTLFARQPDLALAGCRIRKGDTDAEDAACWVYRRNLDRWKAIPFDTFTFAGAGFCVRAAAYHNCGGFWEVIAYSREEEALALRLIDAGWRVAYRPEAEVRHYPDPRGRRQLIDRRTVELKNGMLIYWHAYPWPAGYLFGLLRVVTMTIRVWRRQEGPLRTLWAGWPAARHCWREQELRREPVSWRTLFRVLALHRTRGGGT